MAPVVGGSNPLAHPTMCARSSVWIERQTPDLKVARSNRAGRTIYFQYVSWSAEPTRGTARTQPGHRLSQPHRNSGKISQLAGWLLGSWRSSTGRGFLFVSPHPRPRGLSRLVKGRQRIVSSCCTSCSSIGAPLIGLEPPSRLRSDCRGETPLQCGVPPPTDLQIRDTNGPFRGPCGRCRSGSKSAGTPRC